MRLTALLLLAGALAGCVSVAPKPIDAGPAERLTVRSLDDPQVTEALTRAGLPPPQQAGWGPGGPGSSSWGSMPCWRSSWW